MAVFQLNQLMGIGEFFSEFFRSIWELIGRAFYWLIICAIGRIADICQLIFRKFAGISNTGVQITEGGVTTQVDSCFYQ